MPPRVKGSGGAVASIRVLRNLLVVMLPTLAGVLYYGVLASDRFVAEAQFMVRTAGRPASTGGLGALLQMSGLSRSGDDSYSVQSFMTSREAVSKLSEKLPLAEMYGRREADFLVRYPTFFYGRSIDQFHRYLGWMISSSYSSTTGLTTLSVEAFRPEDSKAVLSALLELGEQRVNELNNRIREDAVRLSLREVDEFQKKLITSQIAITHFRSTEALIDPAGSSIMIMDLIARLMAEAARVEAQIRETTITSPTSPSLAAQNVRLLALQDQVAKERSRIADPAGGLAPKLAEYERLVLDREFTKSALSVAVKGLEQAQTDARRQQLYLQLVVNPSLPDYPLMPQRMRMIWTIFSLNVIGLLVGWLLFAGISQHRVAH